MAGWILVPCLVKLRDEFNAIAPARDHASDGAIGDTAHQAETSDHNPDETGTVPIHDADSTNEVHAIDVDTDLRESDLSMERVVQFLLSRCRSGAEHRLRYVIFNRRIWRASNNWRQEAYTGPSAHTEHVHFSASYDSKLEASTASWHLEDIPVALTDTDRKWIQQQLDARIGDVVPRYDADGKQLPDSDPNPTMAVPSALGYMGRDMGLIKQALGGLSAAVANVSSVDAETLTSAVKAATPAIAAAVIARLPEGGGEITPAKLTDAWIGALRLLLERQSA